MSLLKKSDLFQERLDRFNNALCCFGTPDRVPIFPAIEQWAPVYAGISIIDAYQKDPRLLVEAFRKTYNDITIDACYGTGNLIPLRMMNTFGEGIYTVNETTVQIKGSHGCTMQAEEYPELIADAEKFVLNKVIPRKYPSLAQNDAQTIKTWIKGTAGMVDWFLYDQATKELIERQLDTPVVQKGATFLPGDLMLDFFRDFVGVSQDIRRRPEQFYDACEAIFPFTKQLGEMSFFGPRDGGIVFMPLHLPTYLRPADFEKLYFPFMKREAEYIHSKGKRAMFFCENNWDPYIEMLEDLPGNGTYCYFEHGDLKKNHDILRKAKICMGGGMSTELLKTGTKEECIDQAKWCLDNLAPGGGYMFSPDMVLLSKNDVNPENFAAVTKYIHENGVY